jgi:hypothetical protein
MWMVRQIAKLVLCGAVIAAADLYRNNASQIVQVLVRVAGARAGLNAIFIIGRMLHGEDEILSIL